MTLPPTQLPPETTVIDTVPAPAPTTTTFRAEVIDIPAPVARTASLPDAVTRHGIGGHPAALRFVLIYLLALCVALSTIAWFNWRVDPTGVFGRGPLTGTASDLNVKVHFFRGQPNPDVMLVGSSRMQKFDPGIIKQETGLSAFNASIAGSDMVTHRAWASWAAERAGSKRMPHIVYGITPEDFRSQSTGASLDPHLELRRQLHGGSRRLDDVRTKALPLLQIETVKQSFRRIVVGDQSTDIESQPRKATGEPVDKKWAAGATKVRKDGYLEVGYADISLKNGVTTPWFKNKFNKQYEEFYARRAHKVLSPDAKRELERLLELANAHGDTPAIVLLPMQQLLAAKLAPLGRTQMNEELRLYLVSLQRRYSFRWYDYENVSAFAGDEVRWYDGAHPMIDNVSRSLRQLIRDGGMNGNR